MSVSHTLSYVWSNGGTSLTRSVALTGPAETNVDAVVAPGTTNQEIDVLVNVAQMLSIYFNSSAPIKVTTNSPVAQETVWLNLAPYMWTSAGSQTAPFTNNVAKFFATTISSVATVTLNIRILTQASSF